MKKKVRSFLKVNAENAVAASYLASVGATVMDSGAANAGLSRAPSNSALLTDASSSLRYAYGAAKPGRYVAEGEDG